MRTQPELFGPKHVQEPIIYSLRDCYLEEIFNEFPKFKQIMTIKALRRHHYFRKLKH